MKIGEKIFFKILLLCMAAFIISGCATPEEEKAAHFDRGMEHVAAENFNAAIIEFRNAIQIDPKFAEARYQLGLVFLKIEDARAAFRELERAATLDPTNLDALLKLGEIYLLVQQPEESRQQVETILATDPEYSEALSLLANLELAANNLKKADAAIKQAIAVNPALDRFHIVQARVYSVQGRVVAAERSFKKALGLNPDNINNHRALLGFYLRLAQEDNAKETLKNMIAAFPELAQPHLDLATFYSAKGQMDDAEKSMQTAISIEPDNYVIYMQLGALYRRQGKFEQAHEMYQEALVRTDRPNDVQATIADIFYETRKFDLAKKEIEQIFADNSRHPQAMMVHAKLLLHDGQNQEVVTITDELLQGFPRLGEAWYYNALALKNIGNIRLSEQAAEQAVKYMPYDSNAHALLAHHLLLKREFTEAQQRAGIALRLNPGNFRAAIILGKGLLHNREVDRALQLFVEMDKIVPDNLEILHNKSITLIAADKIPEASEVLEQVLVLEPTFTPALATLTAIHMQQRNPDTAIKRVRAQLLKVPDNPDYLLLLSGLLYNNNLREEALIFLRQAQEIVPEAPRTYLLIARILLDMDKKDNAITEYRTLLMKNNNLPTVHMSLGTLLEQSGDYAGAMKSYREVLELDPQFAPAANNLAWLLTKTEAADLGEALRLAMIAKAAAPDNPYITDTLGFVHYKRGSYRLALTQFTLASEKLPDKPILRYHLALALVGDGQIAQAIKELEKVLKSKQTFSERQEAAELLRSLQGGLKK